MPRDGGPADPEEGRASRPRPVPPRRRSTIRDAVQSYSRSIDFIADYGGALSRSSASVRPLTPARQGSLVRNEAAGTGQAGPGRQGSVVRNESFGPAVRTESSFAGAARTESFGPAPPTSPTSPTSEVSSVAVEEDEGPGPLSPADETTPLVADARRASRIYAEKPPEPGDPHGGAQAHAKSTFMQSLFNSANILVGIGVLSLPFALRLTSFAVGLGLLAVFCILTLYTARVLARLVDLAGDVTTYADVGQMALGNNGRIFIAYFFLTELVCASVALIILASDSIHALIPSWHPYTVKLALFLVVAPTTWPRSLGFLSYFSLLGIVSSLNLMAITFYLGLSTPEAPGSLHEPADGVEWLLPRSWMGMPLATGLLMGSFAGHAVFPSIYVDMEDRKGYPALITLTYGMLVVLYGALAAAGYYMFGSSTAQEITLNFARTPAYPPALVHWTVALVAINPLSKFALTLSPVNAFLERALLPPSLSSATRAALRTASRTAVAAAVFLVAALFPAFERAMGVLGSLFSFTVSAAFPCACVLVLASSGGMRVSLAERIACGVILVASVVLGASGTLWSVMGWA